MQAGLQGDAATFRASFARLDRAMPDHMRTEEAVWWPAVMRVLSLGDVKKLAADLEAHRYSAPTAPHPFGPSTSTAAKILHPLTGFVDRLVDTVTGHPPP